MRQKNEGSVRARARRDAPPEIYERELRSVSRLADAGTAPAVKLGGEAGLKVGVAVQDERVRASSGLTVTNAPEWMNPGNAPGAKGEGWGA